MKKLVTIGVIVLAGLMVFTVMRDQLLKSVVAMVARQVTGTKVDIQGFSLGIVKQTVRIRGLKMYNPPKFPDGVMVDIPRIDVDFDAGALLARKIHLRSVVFELKEIGLVKNSEGVMNVDALKVSQKQEAVPQKKSGGMPLQIDKAQLSIGRVVSKEYTKGKEPSIQVYDININKTYQNITSAEQLAALIIAEPMKAAGIKGAAVYGVAALAGVAVLPVGIAATFVGKDSAQQVFSVSVDKAYQSSLAAIKQKGTVTLQDDANKVIRATVDGAKIEIKVKQTPDKKTEISVSARKFMLPKPEIAGGVLYAITEKLQ